MFLDFGLMSVLLLAAHLLRSRVRALQTFYIPAAFLAGLLGLIGGQQGLGLVPFQKGTDGTELLATYPAMLIVVLFATLFLGHRERSLGIAATARRVADTFLYNLASELGQYGLALLFGLAVLAWWFPDLNAGFALMLPAGFAGGHGTATVVGDELARQGWDQAQTVGYTFATIGLFAGVLGGLALINIGVRLGWTPLVATPQELPSSLRSGFLGVDERRPLGDETVSALALDPLTWPVALVLAACALALLVDRTTRALWPALPGLPLFALSMLAGALLQRLLGAAGLGHTVDRRIVVRIGSAVSDYLIAFGIASVQIPVVMDYALPLLVMSLFGLVYSVALFMLIGPRMFGNFWFERGIFVYGWNTGVVGTGIMLLRCVDPKLRSRTLEDYGLAYTAIAPLEIALLIVLPPLVAKGVVLVPALVLAGGAAGCLLMARCLVRRGTGSDDIGVVEQDRNIEEEAEILGAAPSAPRL
jgi:ESS family glutamate:Na+ symporter